MLGRSTGLFLYSPSVYIVSRASGTYMCHHVTMVTLSYWQVIRKGLVADPGRPASIYRETGGEDRWLNIMGEDLKNQ